MAAAVFIPPSPHNTFPSMATSARRQPLMSIQNAANSPHRLLTLSGSKRTRAVANVSQQENEPPTKKQAVEKSAREPVPVTPQRHRQHDPNGGQVFEDENEAEPTDFQRKLAAARHNPKEKSTRGARDAHRQETESIRAWQKHYKKLFPHFRFYFDSVPADVKKALLKQAVPFGAQEETFFSNKVTHIITGRPIPSDETVSKALENAEGTINPSVLEFKSNGKATARREVINANDIMIRGMQMKMKVWPSEKLQKILNALLDGQPSQEHASRTTKSARANNDLVQVLRNEKIAAAAERDQVAMPRELVSFRGPFIYVHDMDEKVKPIMVREYPKVARRQDGEWPQFRSASIGKCPFVEDVAAKRDIEREAQRQYKAQMIQQQKEAERAIIQSRKESAASQTLEPMKMDPPRRTSPRKVLRDVPNHNAAASQQAVLEKPAPPQRQSSFPPMPEQPPVDFVKPSQMLLVREPSASGIQRSTMTSAIQSQMISSAAATGLKATTSREVHELKRKVLERTHTGSLSLGSIPSSHQANALTGALRNSRAPTHRAAKSKAQEKLGGIQEEVDPYADDMAAERAVHATKKKKPAKREPKPGYCENCHDKYDDFEDHIVSRKHRKFAMTASNWSELDALLEKLQDA